MVTIPHQISPPEPLLDGAGRPAMDGWSLDPEIRHLNHASFGAVPTSAVQVQRELQNRMHARPVEWFPALPAAVGEARQHAARWLGIGASEFGFVANASAAASVVFDNLELPAHCEIVVTDHGYGAVTMGAERAARRVGARVVTAPVDLGCTAEQAAEAVVAAFNDRTAVVIVDQITSPTALRLPVELICQQAADRGILSMVDGAHAPLLEPDPIRAVGADYWFGNLHKFGCAPPGCAVLVPGKDRAQQLFPLIDSWGAPLSFPQRFDHQGTIDLTPWLASPAAFEDIEHRFDWAAVRQYSAGLAAWAQELIAGELGAAIGADCRVEAPLSVGPMRLVALPGNLARTTDEANALRNDCLAEVGIEAAFTSFRGRGFIRLSAHAYNTIDDYLDFVERGIPFLQRSSQRAGSLDAVHRRRTGGEQ